MVSVGGGKINYSEICPLNFVLCNKSLASKETPAKDESHWILPEPNQLWGKGNTQHQPLLAFLLHLNGVRVWGGRLRGSSEGHAGPWSLKD